MANDHSRIEDVLDLRLLRADDDPTGTVDGGAVGSRIRGRSATWLLFTESMRNSSGFSHLRDFASWLWSTGEYFGCGTSDPVVMFIDIPGVGMGAQSYLLSLRAENSP